MEYMFTDWDGRSYKRKTKDNISIAAEYISPGKIDVSLKQESGKSFLRLILARKEAAAIISSLNAAGSECKLCIISTS